MGTPLVKLCNVCPSWWRNAAVVVIITLEYLHILINTNSPETRWQDHSVGTKNRLLHIFVKETLQPEPVKNMLSLWLSNYHDRSINDCFVENMIMNTWTYGVRRRLYANCLSMHCSLLPTFHFEVNWCVIISLFVVLQIRYYFQQCCKSKYFESGYGSWILAQYGSGSCVMLSIVREKIFLNLI